MGNVFRCYKEIHHTSPIKGKHKSQEPIERHYSVFSTTTELTTQFRSKSNSVSNLPKGEENQLKPADCHAPQSNQDLSKLTDTSINQQSTNTKVLSKPTQQANLDEAAKLKQEQLQMLRQRAAEVVKRKWRSSSQPKQNKLLLVNS